MNAGWITFMGPLTGPEVGPEVGPGNGAPIAIGHPGPWRTGSDDASASPVFELPLAAFPAAIATELAVQATAGPIPVAGETHVSEPEGSPPRGERGPSDSTSLGVLRELREWAAATWSGAPPAGWRATPQLGAVESDAAAFTTGALGVHARAQVARGELFWREDRVALRYPRIAELDGDLPESRREWALALGRDAQSRWRFVRVGYADGALAAEVDLTGAPLELLRPLLYQARSALRHVVARLLPVLAVVTDPTVESDVLDRAPEVNSSRAPEHREQVLAVRP